MDISDLLNELVQSKVHHDAPGAAVGIYRDGALIHHAAAGLANVEFSVPVDLHTRFDTASVSKQFTATAALLLCADGRLSMEDDLRSHLPELQLPTPVTVEQCLRHTAGLPDWLSVAQMAGLPLTRISQEQVLAFVAGLTALNFEPDSRFSYSNTGYVLVASLIERLAGMTLGEFAARRIFCPLGMRNTLYREDTMIPLPLFANGYLVDGKGVSRADTEECAVGDGGLVTSIADLGPWFGFLQDGRVLGAELKNALVRSTSGKGETPRLYALGLAHMSICGQRALAHSGEVPGYRSQLIFLPETGIGVAVLSNNSSVKPRQIAVEALQLATGLTCPGAPQTVVVDPGMTYALSGYWVDPATDVTLHVEPIEDGRVALSGGFLNGEFVATTGGVWQGLDDSADFRLQVKGALLQVSSTFRPGDDSYFRRCEPPSIGATMPAAAYRNPELGALATITEDGELELGLQTIARLQPAPDGAFTAGDLLTLRLSDDRLLVSAEGVYRLPFIREQERPETLWPLPERPASE
ncbi:serine hydrolase domain-containing protein [Paenarthrobacter sp. NPDC090517]|uniref:serine hydrolase domain-containing protein n=1 Tax=Paenarthrobacter sp. NPDC090517 TaxID=3364381 RepID=UPI00382B6E81